MGALDVLARLSALGLRLTREGEAIRAAPRSALTDEARNLIRVHKSALLAAIGRAQEAVGRTPETKPALDDTLARSYAFLVRRVWAKLEERPETDLAVIADDELDPEAVLIAVARRDRFACVLRVDPQRYDGVRLLELIERHTIH